MNIYESPQSTSNITSIRIFLAGSIEMGNAIDWQTEAIELIEKRARFTGLGAHKITIYNPRREKWNPDLPQEFENPEFFQQVTWELDNLEKSNHILFFIQAGTKSPITLLELGLMVNSGKRVVVICEEGFWRKGNVDIICNRYGIRQENNLTSAIFYLLNNNHDS